MRRRVFILALAHDTLAVVYLGALCTVFVASLCFPHGDTVSALSILCFFVALYASFMTRCFLETADDTIEPWHGFATLYRRARSAITRVVRAPR